MGMELSVGLCTLTVICRPFEVQLCTTLPFVGRTLCVCHWCAHSAAGGRRLARAPSPRLRPSAQRCGDAWRRAQRGRR